MINILIDLFLILAIYLIIAILWQSTEKCFYGYITPRIIDDFVALFLAVSIYFNIKS